MKRAIALAVVALAALPAFAACTSKKEYEAHFVYKDAGPRENPAVPEPRVDPSPMTDACQTTCTGLTVVGSVVELQPPFEDSGGDSSVTFGKGNWYVAWGGRPALVTQIQRFTADGKPAGATRRVERTTPGQLVWNPRGDGELDLLAEWWPANDAMTDAAWLRFDPNLAPTAGAFRIQEVKTIRYGYDRLEIQGTRLERTSTLDRTQPMVRLQRLDPAGGAGQRIEQSDWYAPSKSSWLAVNRVGDKRLVAYAADGALQVAGLGANGSLGTPSRAIEGLAATPSVLVRSAMVGKDLWVAAFVSEQPPSIPRTVLLRRIDPATLAVLDAEPIRIAWPTGHPSDLIAANGTLALVGDLEGDRSPLRWSFVPVDTQARAVCRPSTVVVVPDRSAHQTIRAVHFEGDTAGVTLDTWTGSGPRHMYFTRLACTRPAP
ncbi:hypothetical protein LVJ94_44000 [Pendulispora rubella]|uniref:Lipoprotein n=1 Tax=Pendulispora rubella TaxID=2741070 RepID=A0ABZ2KZ45_9BACT